MPLVLASVGAKVVSKQERFSGRLLVTDVEPHLASREVVWQQDTLNFSFSASEGPREGIDRLEKANQTVPVSHQEETLTMTRGQEFR